VRQEQAAAEAAAAAAVAAEQRKTEEAKKAAEEAKVEAEKTATEWCKKNGFQDPPGIRKQVVLSTDLSISCAQFFEIYIILCEFI
jgi:hypothetical protein